MLLSILLLQGVGKEGEPNVWIFVACVLIIFLVVITLMRMLSKPPPKGEDPDPLHVELAKMLGPFHQLNDHTGIAGKMISSDGDVDTYATLTVVDKSHVRKEVIDESNKRLDAKRRMIRILFWVILILALYILTPYMLIAYRAWYHGQPIVWD